MRAERATIYVLLENAERVLTGDRNIFLRVNTLKHQFHRPIHMVQIDDTSILIV